MQAEKEIVSIFPSFLKGGGEMGTLIREYDWSVTALGKPEYWPQSLRTALGIMLSSRFPMFLFWGADHICFYNDAFLPNLSAKGQHPFSLGRKGEEAWAEIWVEIKPCLDKVQKGNDASWNDVQPVPVVRNRRIEDIYWTSSYSPVYDESGKVAGVFVTCSETNEKVNAQKQLEANQHDLNLALEIAELGTYRLNLATNFVTLSDRIKNWFGFSKHEITLGRLKSLMHPNDLYRVAKALNDTTKPGEINQHDIQYTVIEPVSGNERHLRSIGKTIFDDQGMPFSIEGILQDITPLVIAGRKIEQSEARFRNLIRHATVGVIVLLGPNMVVDMVNEFYCQVFAKSYKELIGKPLFDVIPEMNGSYRKQLDRVRNTGIPMYIYERPFFVLKDGDKKQAYINLVHQPLKEKNDEISGVVVLLHDVTEQVTSRQRVEYAEQRARLTVDIAGLGVYEVNLKTDEIIPDANFCKIYGFDHPMARSEFLSVVYPEDVEIRNRAHAESVITGHLEYEGRLRWKDNSVHWVHVMGKVFYDENKAAVKLLGVVQDITEQKMVSEELEKVVATRTKDLAEANQRLLQTNIELNQFAYIASHDLQEPLRKITTYTGMLESSLQKVGKESSNYIDKITNSSNRMKDLICDVLVFSQLSDDAQAFQILALDDILAGVINDFGKLIQEKGAIITSAELPEIEAMPFQMTQLFTHLISNGLTFNKKNTPPEIDISSRKLSPEEISLLPGLKQNSIYHTIVFKDKGIGFSTEYAEKIFAIFQRLHNREHFEGTGIGLAICRKITTIHNGLISASSKENNGAVFSVVLPAKQ